jgi:SOS-response transcriptional repressor LexA
VIKLPSLTARQKAIYDFLLKTIREKGFAPSIHEIGRQFKIASTNGVSDHLKALEKKGYIRRVRQAGDRDRQRVGQDGFDRHPRGAGFRKSTGGQTSSQ